MTELHIGVLAVALASAMLLLCVMRELAPAGGLTGRGRWLLAAALGAGIVAFLLKVLVVGLLLRAPDTLLRHPLAPPPSARQDPDVPLRAAAGRYRWQALPGVAASPEGNPATPQKVALGKRLFFDKNLSLDGQLSCATCHDLVAAAGADGRSVSRGIDGQLGERNAPTVWNAAFQARLFWDGRADSLEAQAKGPLVNPREMGMPSLDAVMQRVQVQADYRRAFAQVFGAADRLSIDQLVAAIAAYERTLITPDSPYDRFVRGDDAALTEQQLRGMALFESVGCVQCHSGPNFSGASVFDPSAPFRAFPAQVDAGFEPLQLSQDPGLAAAGSGQGVWRIPSLRNVALTAPYFHNGSARQLDEAVRVMASAQLGLAVVPDPQAALVIARSQGNAGPPQVFLTPAGGGLGAARPWGRSAGQGTLQLAARAEITQQDVRAIVAFLEALSGDELAARAGRAAYR